MSRIVAKFLVGAALVALAPCATVAAAETGDGIAALIRQLKEQVARVDADARRIEGNLFSSPEQIARLCRLPYAIEPDPKRDTYLDGIAGDPASLPAVDCVFLGAGDRSSTLLSFRRADDGKWFVTLERSWVIPSGLVSISKHPLHRVQSTMLGWTLNRSVPVRARGGQAFPIGADADFYLEESQPGEQRLTSHVWVARSFPVNRDGETLDRLHVVIRDLGTRSFFGEPTPLRQWYLYSERANAVLRRSRPQAPDAALSLDSTDITFLAYYADGAWVAEMTADDLAPLRAFLGSFDIWADAR